MGICEVQLVKSVQEKISNILFSSKYILAEDEREAIKKCLAILNSRTDEILVFVQLILKVRNELVFAKLDLERIPAEEKEGSNAFRRVTWLKEKLCNLSQTCHEMFFALDKELSEEVLSIASYGISQSLGKILHEATRNALFKSCKCGAIQKTREETELGKIQESLKKLRNVPQKTMISKKPSFVIATIKETSTALPKILESTDNEMIADGDKDSGEKDLNETSQTAPIEDCKNNALNHLVTKLQTIYDEVEDAAMATVTGSEDDRGRKKKESTLKLPEIPNVVPPLSCSRKSAQLINENETLGENSPTVPLINIKADNNHKSRPLFPRSPLLWCGKEVSSPVLQLNYLRNKDSKNSLNTTEKEEEVTVKFPSRSPTEMSRLKRCGVRIKVINKVKNMLPSNRDMDFAELKEQRIEDLIGSNGLDSANPNIAVDAARSAGQLRNRDKRLLKKLKEMIKGNKADIVAYECAKSLLSLGSYCDDAVRLIIQYLRKGTVTIQLDLLDAMKKSTGIQFVDKKCPAMVELSEELLNKVKACDEEEAFTLSFKAALCLAHFRMIVEDAKLLLLKVLKDNQPFKMKILALNALVKEMRCDDDLVIDSLLEQMQFSTCWKHRLQSAGLLQSIGLKRLKSYGLHNVYKVLNDLLWDHPNKEFRDKVAHLLEFLEMKNVACADVLRKLEDKCEITRAEGIISLATLRMKGEKELKILLDIFELDSSVYVRTQVIRTFVALQWNHPRVIRALQERQRGAGDILSVEATKALKKLKACV